MLQDYDFSNAVRGKYFFQARAALQQHTAKAYITKDFKSDTEKLENLLDIETIKKKIPSNKL